MFTVRLRSACLCALAICAASCAVMASDPAATQSIQTAPAPENSLPEWMARLAPQVDTPQAKAYAKAQKTRLETEKELKQLRAKYFRQTKNVETRQVGFSKLQQYTDPALFPTLIEIFGSEAPDVRDALLDHFAMLRNEEADISLTWCAVFGKDKAMRQAASKRVVARMHDLGGKPSLRVQTVIATGLKQNTNDTVAAAAQLAQLLHLYEAIPMMIAAQVTQSGNTSGSVDDDGSALAYILVGTQQAFVSDLTPVVGDNAVAFDPTLSVLTEGTYIRIIDAVVVTYRTEVNAALVALSTEGWGGQSTASLGWDNRAWRTWYATEFVPYRKKVEAAQADQPKP